jgi:secreted PhoX family phosphatase
MGRFKHEGANVIVARDGHVVAYMGDDERFDYLYKFVSPEKYRPGDRRHNMALLESGTKMDRPEDVQPSPRTGKIYAAMTNNTSRTAAQADEANPRANNRHGHIFEITEDRGDHTSETFTWTIVCGDPADPSTFFAGYDKTKVSPISCPDNAAFDSAGNLWIATDGNALGGNDGLFATIGS